MRKFLLDCQIPDIKILNPDTENFDIYQSIFYNQNLNYLDKISDGHFLIKKIEDKIVVEEYPIAVEIKYTSTEEHDSNQLLKLKKLAMGYPLIFFSLGSSEDYYQFLIKTIEQWNLESKLLYPILALRLPKNLLSPLLILSNRLDPQYITCINLLIAWACRFCPIVYHIENFISHLPEKLYKRQITLKIESLKPTGKDDNKISSFQYSINALCSIINTITKHKLIHVLEKEFKVEFKKKFPQLIEDSNDIFNQLLKELISINMIEQFDYGKNKTLAIKKVKLNWNMTEGAQKLSSKFV